MLFGIYISQLKENMKNFFFKGKYRKNKGKACITLHGWELGWPCNPVYPGQS